ncbi:MAG: phosphate ABC transporter permease subunit PstC [Proteobacteria bacterium]|nr:phosphate ABC transporter permease subunit PstC [Pseudomonadota bacterium]
MSNLRTANIEAKDARIKVRWIEFTIVRSLMICALISVVTTLAIVVILAKESSGFFQEVSIYSFLAGLEWNPLIEPRQFGVIPLVLGTLLVSVGACIIAIPIGLGTAIYLSEYASQKTRQWLKPTIELLAGVPSVVFGYFAVTSITPLLQSVFPSTEIFNAASAAIVLSFMVLPTITSLSDDALSAVPRSLREGGYALAATKREVSLGILLPAATSGILAACILGFSRAIGETMAVALAAGSTPNLSLNPLQSAQTMTGYIVQVSMGDTPHGSVEYQSIFAVAALLFLMTFSLNVFSQSILKRLQKSYD